ARAGWLEGWSKIEREAVEGDPVAAFDAALTLPRPPAVPTPEPWPTEGTLLQALAQRLAGNLAECRPTIDSPPEALHDEERLEELLIELAERVAASPPSPDREYFGAELDRLIAAIAAQRDERSTALRTRMQQQVLAQQDWLLGAARAHAAAGQLEQAVEVYDELLALEGSADLVPLLEAEVQKVREQYDALLRAFDHATAGRHADALSELERHAMDPRQHLLPWRVETSPSGARVRYGEGHTRTTPFVMYSSFGTPLKLEFELEGCERRQVEVSRPTDLTVHMHRMPERRWATGAQVDAAPISVGPDHVFFDRAGRVERVDGRGGVKWSVSLPTLGGFARTPLFVPARPGTLLLVAEDGKAWFLDSADGGQEGPFDLGSPPEHGPYPMRGRIGAYFSNGTVAIWDASPEPQLLPAPSLGDQSDDWARRDGAEGDGSIMVLRRNAKAGEELASKWTRWRVDVLDEHYRVTRGADDEKAFTARREGAWSFVAWEAPNTLVPEGRLWVSDEGGLRSFLPVER
ncbi:MAG TPA: hypothetical protein VJP77_04980, partial [Planctomycetota bacterium]|nr:hypothetical protein [Planctomycetota bacterium]